MPATALITGITGQDGSYLAELLLEKGYRVVGIVRRSNIQEYERLRHIQDKLTIVQADLFDQASLADTLERHQPDEIYNLAGFSVVGVSWQQAVLDAEVTGVGVTRLLEAVRVVCPRARVYQASTSEMFGEPVETPQTETTPFHPRNPYGVSKLYGHWITLLYREHRGLYAVSGILYNHESPRRGLEFVSRKITHAAASIKLGLAKDLRLGRLEDRRDWGFARDYVRAMWMMLQRPAPEDFLVATGETHCVAELCDIAFAHLDLDYREYVVQDPVLIRAPEKAQLVGNPEKAHCVLGWQPTVDFRAMVEIMVDADLARLSSGGRA